MEFWRGARKRKTKQKGKHMAVDVFLKLEGIPGESKDENHKDWIIIDSFSWGATNSSPGRGSGSGGGAGKVSMNDLSFTQLANKSTPLLMAACATGKHIKEGIISVRKSGGDGKPQPYLTYKLQDVLITSYSLGGSAGDHPSEELSLNFSKVSFSYLGGDGESSSASCGK
jgi:type VI secretion system secreted protein Hcp